MRIKHQLQWHCAGGQGALKQDIMDALKFVLVR